MCVCERERERERESVCFQTWLNCDGVSKNLFQEKKTDLAQKSIFEKYIRQILSLEIESAVL